MDRYINREALIESIRNGSGTPLQKLFAECCVRASDADAVEVVRCKDCIYYNSNCCFNRQWDFESSSEVPLVRENDFCSYGERKEK